MDRRNFIQQSSGAFAATALGMSGLTPCVNQSGEVLGYAQGVGHYEADFSRTNADGTHPAVWKPYDPIAVLEAMRERGFWFEIGVGSELTKWLVAFQSEPVDTSLSTAACPDFPSAVRWLHRQAAAVDEGFARDFPVPE